MVHQSDLPSATPPLIWLIPATIGAIAVVTVNLWLPDPLASYHAEQARLMDDEDDVVCRKFVIDTERLPECRSEIRRLRQRDRDAGLFI